LLAHAAAGAPERLIDWLIGHPGYENIRVAPGIAPKLLRATVPALPPAWALMASFVKVNHLDLCSDGQASWYVSGARDEIMAVVHQLSRTQDAYAKSNPEELDDEILATQQVRCRPVYIGSEPVPVTRRQFEALSTAVSLGYFEIPHRIDLRSLDTVADISLGSVSQLLRRAESTILTNYVDAKRLDWPVAAEDELRDFRPAMNLLLTDRS